MASLLLLFGVAFLIANARGVWLQFRYWQRRRTALLTWPARRPPLFSLQIATGAALGLLFLYNLLFRRAATEQTFGLGMMLVYYGYVVPASTRIERGFYRDGVWSDQAFVPYRRIGALAWREEPEPTLLLAPRTGHTARRLVVPGEMFGAVRRLLRDLIGRHTIQIADAGLHLGFRDERDDV